MNETIFALIGGSLQTLPSILTILNVLILLFVIYFFTSTLASHLLEYFVGRINSRGSQLHDQLTKVLGEEHANDLFENSLIKSLSGDGKGTNKKYFPSYIEPEIMARVISFEYSRENGNLKSCKLFDQLHKEAGGDESKFKNNIIDWFKALNDRQNGIYTRWSFMRLFVIGLLLASLMDIDSMHIASSLWGKPQIAEKLVSDLEKAVPALSSGDPARLTDTDRKRLQDSIVAAWPDIRAGATTAPLYAWQGTPSNAEEWGAKAIGWLITALATSLGAQFWFNLLGEAYKLRATGRKPDDKSDKSEKNKAADKDKTVDKLTKKE